MSFRVVGLDPAPFAPLYGLPDAQLRTHRARRVIVGSSLGVPDRASLRDLPVGATALLVNHVHQPAESPFHACHAVYVEEGATTARVVEGRVPRVLRTRLLSLRAFDRDGMLVDADVVDGEAAETRIVAMLAGTDVDVLHAHFARPGCFGARIERL